MCTYPPALPSSSGSIVNRVVRRQSFSRDDKVATSSPLRASNPAGISTLPSHPRYSASCPLFHSVLCRILLDARRPGRRNIRRTEASKSSLIPRDAKIPLTYRIRDRTARGVRREQDGSASADKTLACRDYFARHSRLSLSRWGCFRFRVLLGGRFSVALAFHVHIRNINRIHCFLDIHMYVRMRRIDSTSTGRAIKRALP